MTLLMVNTTCDIGPKKFKEIRKETLIKLKSTNVRFKYQNFKTEKTILEKLKILINIIVVKHQSIRINNMYVLILTF
jgi:hypothetical protein